MSIRDVAIVGTSMTKFGRSNKTELEMFAEAALDSIYNSDIEPKNIEELYLGNCAGAINEGQVNMCAHAAEEIGLHQIPSTTFEGACASSAVAFIHAYREVAAGYNDTVLVAGTERNMTLRPTGWATRVFQCSADQRYTQFTGLTFPGIFAMAANRYMKKYDISKEAGEEALACVSVKNHHNGALNPKAHLQKEITIDTVLQSPKVADPLKLYDCCPFSDGAAALVLTSAEKAKKLTDTPIYVAGVGQSSQGSLCTQSDITYPIGRAVSSKKAYKQAKIEPKDIDIAEVHDCFTSAEIIAIEALGLFERGHGWKAEKEGETAIDGKLPINTSGGLKAKGHPIGATGCAQIHEIVEQLRGDAGKRQVNKVEVGLADNMGGEFGTITTIILRR